MYPVLLQIGTFQISTYGFMLMMAFIINNYLLKKYLISIGKNGQIAEDIIFYAAIGGIIGAKICGFSKIEAQFSSCSILVTLNF